MSIIPQSEENNKPEIHLSRLSYALLARITELRNKFTRAGTLQKDGSFFQSNVEFAKWLHCSERGIIKARLPLIAAGYIKFKPIAVKGKSSHYWVLENSPIQAPKEENKDQERPPLNTQEVKAFCKATDRNRTISFYERAGYSLAEIISALGEPK